MTPQTVRDLGVAGMRRLGLHKRAYCHGLSARLLSGELDLTRVALAHDEVGPRGAARRARARPLDIYYLMALRRPDVWPTSPSPRPSTRRFAWWTAWARARSPCGQTSGRRSAIR